MSDKDDDVLLQNATLGVGDILRRERLRQKLTLDDIAVVIRVSKGYLRDIEQNQFDNLPGKPYVIGFVRTYAEFLKLNSEGLVDQVKLEMNQGADEAEMYQEQPAADVVTKDRGFLYIVLLLIIAAIVVGIVYYVNSSSDNSADDAMSAANKVADTQQSSGSIAAPATTAVPSDNKGFPVAPHVYGTKGRSDFVVKATSQAWFQIMDRTGHVVFSKMLIAGDQYRIPMGSYMITTGNAGALSISFRGRVEKVLGKDGEARNNVLISYRNIFGVPKVSKGTSASANTSTNASGVAQGAQ